MSFDRPEVKLIGADQVPSREACMPKAIRVEQYGGPEVLKWSDVDVGKPGANQLRLRQTAIGVNFIDIYFRTGMYKAPEGLPFTPGSEGTGVVEEVGEGVTGFAAGDRVVYQGGLGSYAEARLVPAERCVKLPEDIDDKTAAAVFLKGVTVHSLLFRTFPVTKGTTLLWHAASGGVGVIASQWASALGATVIGTVGSAEKAALAKKNGVAHVINYREENFAERVKEITGGKGVDVVYDAVGKDTFPGSLDSLRPLGMWVSFGAASGPPPEFPVSLLQQKGSLFATRPTIVHYLAKRPDLETAAHGLFDVLRAKKVKVEIGQEFPLSAAAEAQKALESRKTTGSTVLLP
jgi:NADPH2:quinone reductase